MAEGSAGPGWRRARGGPLSRLALDPRRAAVRMGGTDPGRRRGRPLEEDAMPNATWRRVHRAAGLLALLSACLAASFVPAARGELIRLKNGQTFRGLVDRDGTLVSIY